MLDGDTAKMGGRFRGSSPRAGLALSLPKGGARATRSILEVGDAIPYQLDGNG